MFCRTRAVSENTSHDSSGSAASVQDLPGPGDSVALWAARGNHSARMAFDPVDFLERAVAVPSHEDVGPMRDLLVETIESAGVTPSVDEAGNVLARRGEGAPHVVLNTHVDTVPPHVPFERDGEVIRGRGSCDAKGPLAALLAAFLGADPEDGRLTLAITPNEETTQAGAARLRERFGAAGDVDAFVVGEPTGLDVCTAARGQFEGEVVVRGSAAHAASPAEGRNAIRAAAPILEAMDTFDEAAGTPAHETLGEPTLTATVIDGGEAHNQVPARCRIVFDRRSVPPEDSGDVPGALEAHLREVLPPGFDLSVELLPRETPLLEAFATDEDAPVVRALVDASGGAVRPFGAATEASYFAEVAPTVVFGPGDLFDEEGAVAHAEREYVRVPAVRAAADALGEAVDRLVG